MSKNRPALTPQRVILIFREMRFWRRMYFMDNPFEKSRGIINAAKFWEWFQKENSETVKIQFDRNLDRTITRVAFVLRLEPNTRLVASNDKFERAKKGNWFFNYVFAHEFAHIALGHSATSTAPKPFSKYEDPNDGMQKDLVDDIDELEANIGGVFLQVGEQVFDNEIDINLLVKSAATNEVTLRRLIKICQLDSVQHLWKESQKISKVIL